jgi:lipid II:glycine glycyltransferase (peptidoglycan interpeptide bridge formation enzyme)
MSDLFSIKKITATEFDKLKSVLKPVKFPIEQTPMWGDFDNAISNRKFLGSYSYFDESGRLVALASATLYSQKGRDWIWIKHGPLFASIPNTQIIQKMCATLKNQFSTVDEFAPLFIRLSMPSRTKGLYLPFEHTMYDETVVLDLEKSEEELLAEMSQSGRQGYRKAMKNDIQVTEITENRLKVFKNKCYPILEETGKRGGFGIHPLSLYIAMLEALKKNARLYCSYHNKKVVAWAITTEYDNQALYYYGGSNIEARDTSAPYLLHFEIIKAMKARGNKTYDFMGIAGKNYPSLANVTQFKLKFSKNIVKVPQAYDLPLQQLKYKLLTSAIKLKRKLK